MKICKRCIQPDTRPGVFFNENNICGACIWEERKKEIDWTLRERELKKISEWAKKSTESNYDCVIGVSGGKDSTKQALTARDKLGLRCLLVNAEPEGMTNIGKENIENLKKIGFDVISLRPNPKTMKLLIKYDFFKCLNPVKITEFSLYSSTYIIADQFRIPLIIQGENPGLTLGTSLTGVGTDSNAMKVNELQTLSSGWEEYLKIDGLEKKDLFLFHYDRKNLEERGYKAIWLNYFLEEWSNHNNAIFSKEHGLKWRSENFDPNTIGTYLPYFQLDGDLTPVNQLLKYIKFGFGQCMDHVCYDLREGRITREKAVELVKMYDGKCSNEYIEKFCKFIGISFEEFWETAEKFRGNMWEKTANGDWKNKILDLL